MYRDRPSRSRLTIGGAALSLVVGLATSLAAAEPRPILDIPLLDSPPTLEDFLEMGPNPEWEGRMARASGFIQQIPEDGQPASQRTEAYLGYDAQNFYAVFVAHDDEPERVRAHFNRRENISGEDLVEVMLDTFGDGQRAYAFVVTPLGIQWDAIWTEGRQFDSSWDTVWHSRARLTDRGYVVWMAIPFKSLRFPDDGRDWRLILLRDIQRNNESAFWPRVSSRIEGRLNQAATLRGLRGISPGRNIQLIPYAGGRRVRTLDREAAAFDRDDLDADVGLDAKIVLRDRLALDLTANPDFSQVESDAPQVTVNERFEVFFPEKRPFFLENAGFFATPFNLLFTRRIGDPSLGSRLTGKVGSFAMGGLLIDDESPPEDPDDARARFGVLRLRRDLPRQSSIGFMLTDRAIGSDVAPGRFADAYNRVGSIDGRIKLDDNWDTSFQAVYSKTRTPRPAGEDEDGDRLSDHAYSLAFNRQGRQFRTHIHYQDVGREFRTASGFVPRTDIRDMHQDVSYAFRPEGARLVSWTPSIFAQKISDHDGTRLDWRLNPQIEWEFRRQTNLNVFGSSGRERLRPEDTFGESRDFPTRNMGVSFSTRFVQSLVLSASVQSGRGINFVPADGQETPADVQRGSLQLGVLPGRRLRVDNSYLLTRLEDVDGSRILTNEIVRTRWNWQLDTRLSLRTILQYERTRSDSELTDVEARRRINVDFLVAYLVNPWTAFYLGYNSNYENLAIDRESASVGRGPERDLLNDARQIFFKASYLYRF